MTPKQDKPNSTNRFVVQEIHYVERNHKVCIEKIHVYVYLYVFSAHNSFHLDIISHLNMENETWTLSESLGHKVSYLKANKKATVYTVDGFKLIVTVPKIL